MDLYILDMYSLFKCLFKVLGSLGTNIESLVLLTTQIIMIYQADLLSHAWKVPINNFFLSFMLRFFVGFHHAACMTENNFG